MANGKTTAPPDAAEAKQRVREAGLRATAARIAVVRELARQSRPASHGEVVDALADLGFDQSTLFRCLNELADAGLVARLDLGDHVRRFELTTAATNGAVEHPHFMCTSCGELSCLSGYEIRVTPKEGGDARPIGSVSEVLVRGVCARCG
ncbi:MAG: transcriptional repressor [Planctomycetota bacterium]